MQEVWLLLILVAIAAVVAILIAVPHLYVRKHRVGGFGWLERRHMYRMGSPAHATVIDFVLNRRFMDDVFVLEWYTTYRLVLEVTPQGAPPFRAQLELGWATGKWSLMQVGRVLPVIYAGGRVMLDYPALGRETAAARAAERAAAEERQRRLLDGK